MRTHAVLLALSSPLLALPALAEPLQIAPVVRDTFSCDFEFEDSFGEIHSKTVQACSDRETLEACYSNSSADLCTRGELLASAELDVNGRKVAATARFQYTHALWLEAKPGHLQGAKQYVCDTLALAVSGPDMAEDSVANFCDMPMHKGWRKTTVSAEGVPAIELKDFKRTLEFPDHRYGQLRFKCAQVASEPGQACAIP